MSKPKPITSTELDAIKQSVKAAEEKFIEVYDPSPSFKTPEAIFKLLIGDIIQRKKTKLEYFLLEHWAESKDGFPELFSLKPIALLRICRALLNLPQLSEDALTKTRQRLGLKPFKRQKRDAVFCGGRWTFPQVDNR